MRNSYHPIFNLSFLSKPVEHIMTARYTTHAEQLLLFPARQSAYFHSTETIRTADEGKVMCLVLDLSAAFITVDHDILLDVLQQRVLVHRLALKYYRLKTI